MCHAIKLTAVDDCCAHVEGGPFLMPLLGNDPFTPLQVWVNASQPAVFPTHQDMPVMDRWGGHVLIRSPVGQMILPELSAGIDFNSL